MAGTENLHLEVLLRWCLLIVRFSFNYDAALHMLNYATFLNLSVRRPMSADENELVTVVEIPTVYGGEFGPDLGFVASHNPLTEGLTW